MITRLLLAVPLIFLGWIGVLAGIMLASDDAPAAVVLFPSSDFISNLPQDVAILSTSRISITLSSDLDGFGRLLYHAGGRLVLPAGLLGCLPLPAVQ